jgi:hypothetical protein
MDKKKKRKENEKELPIMDIWRQLSRLYGALGESDILLGISKPSP